VRDFNPHIPSTVPRSQRGLKRMREGGSMAAGGALRMNAGIFAAAH